MKMPVHMFISLGNILAGQFKKEAEEQKKQQEGMSNTDIPNLRQMSSNLPDISSMLSGFSSQLPSMSSL